MIWFPLNTNSSVTGVWKRTTPSGHKVKAQSVCQPQQKLLLCWFHDLLKSTIISLWCNAIICLLSQDYDLLPRSIISTTIWCCFFYSAVTVTVSVTQCVDCGAGGPVLLIVIDLWILSIDWWMIQHTEI